MSQKTIMIFVVIAVGIALYYMYNKKKKAATTNVTVSGAPLANPLSVAV